MSQETPLTPQQPRIERPNGHRPVAAPKKSLQLSPTMTVIILAIIATVIFILPSNGGKKAEVAAPVAVAAPAAPVEAQPVATAPIELKALTPEQENLQYQALAQQVASLQQDLATLTQKLQTLQEMLTLLQQNEHAKADAISKPAK